MHVPGKAGQKLIQVDTRHELSFELPITTGL
jgi:hypothetical protein